MSDEAQPVFSDTTKAAIAGQVRHLLTLAAGALGATALVSNSTEMELLTQLGSAVALAGAGAGWSYAHKKGWLP